MIEVRVNELRYDLGFSLDLFIGEFRGDSNDWRRLSPQPNTFRTYDEALEAGIAWGKAYIDHELS